MKLMMVYTLPHTCTLIITCNFWFASVDAPHTRQVGPQYLMYLYIIPNI